MDIKGAIFDLDGTLFDSLWVWAEIDKRFLHKRGLLVPEYYSEKISSMSFIESARYTVELFGLREEPERLMQEWLDMSREIYAKEITLKKGAEKFLIRLKSKGIKLGIATSSAPDLYLPALKNNGILDFFSVIMDTSSSPGKAHPDIFLSVAKKMELIPCQCVVFEDLPIAIKSAKRGGFKTVAIKDAHTDSNMEADLIIDDFTDLDDRIL